MAASRPAGLDRNRDRTQRDAGAARRRGRARKPGVEALEQLWLLSLAAPPPIDEIPIPTPNAAPVGIAVGPDGAMWFTENNANKIGRLSAGSLTEYPIPTAASSPYAITAGSDGALWFTELFGNNIGRITTSGAITEFPIPTAHSDPFTIAAGPDGALWFAENNSGIIGRITTAGVITEYPTPIDAHPLGITAGPDGALWFTQQGSIGRITTAGAVSAFPISNASTNGSEITEGPDGALWFTEFGANKIGRITTAGALTEIPLPTASSDPFGIAAGPDGDVWFTENAVGKIGRITPAGKTTELSTSSGTSFPWLITAGPDGNLWFAEQSGDKIGRVDLAGYRMADIPVPTTNSAPESIAAGPDGALWFTEGLTNQIGRITTAGAVTEFPVLTNFSTPGGIAAGPDGALWFTEVATSKIGRITTSGKVTEYSTKTASSQPEWIAAGPDGAMWFTEQVADKIGRIDTSGNVIEYSLSSEESVPTAIAAGPDGALWFTVSGPNKIGRITTDGNITEYPLLSTPEEPDAIAAGPDGALWFTELNEDKIGRIATDGTVTEFDLPSALSLPEGIAAGPDGALWFTEYGTNKIGRITTTGNISEFPIPTSSSGAFAIAAGPDRALWFTELIGNRIGRLALPLAAVGGPPSPAEGVPFSGVVATFAYPDPAATPADFAANIVWGDGTITPGQVVHEAIGDFVVTGQHTYARGGQSYPVSVAVLDPDSRTIIASVTANVAAAPLVAAAAPVATTEGAAVSAGTTLAIFTDTGGADPLSAYTATVAWGDGTTTAPANVLLTGAGFQVVAAAPHTYADEGSYSVLVTITEVNAAGAVINTVSVSGAAIVADAPLSPVGVQALTTPKGTPLIGAVVASFTDSDSAASSADFTATIDWGDGAAESIGVVFQPGGAGTPFVVAGNHTYAVDRSTAYPITVSIRDRGGAAVTSGSQATVSDVAPLVSGIPVKFTRAEIFSATVADISEVTGAAPEPISHYSATINWGDRSATTTGTIEAIEGGAWVVGSHTYTGLGPYTVTVTVHDDGGAVVTATATAYDPPARAAGSAAGSLGRLGASPWGPLGIPTGSQHHWRRGGRHHGLRQPVAQVNDLPHRHARLAQAIRLSSH
jgi:streptogramin lyase